MLVATVKGLLQSYIGAKVEYQGQLWEVRKVECIMNPLGRPYRDTRTPVGLLVKKVDAKGD